MTSGAARVRTTSGLALLMLALLAQPAHAQAVSVPTADQVRGIDRRVQTLESQMRAVQRQVFPGGDRRLFSPEIEPRPAEPATAAPATAAVGERQVFELMQRLDAAEAAQRQLTGQVEELGNLLRQMEAGLQRVRADTEFRLDALEGRPAAGQPVQGGAASGPPASPARASSAPTATPPAATSPAAPSPAPAGTAPAAAAPPPPGGASPADVEAAYRAAYAQYQAGAWERAARELQAFAEANPQSARASNAQYWAGRALAQLNRHPEAARAFLQGYQRWPRGAMAPPSLLWLSRSLLAMDQPQAACQALDQLRDAYGAQLTGQLAADAQATRARARCP